MNVDDFCASCRKDICGSCKDMIDEISFDNKSNTKINPLIEKIVLSDFLEFRSLSDEFLSKKQLEYLKILLEEAKIEYDLEFLQRRKKPEATYLISKLRLKLGKD